MVPNTDGNKEREIEIKVRKFVSELLSGAYQWQLSSITAAQLWTLLQQKFGTDTRITQAVNTCNGGDRVNLLWWAILDNAKLEVLQLLLVYGANIEYRAERPHQVLARLIKYKAPDACRLLQRCYRPLNDEEKRKLIETCRCEKVDPMEYCNISSVEQIRLRDPSTISVPPPSQEPTRADLSLPPLALLMSNSPIEAHYHGIKRQMEEKILPQIALWNWQHMSASQLITLLQRTFPRPEDLTQALNIYLSKEEATILWLAVDNRAKLEVYELLLQTGADIFCAPHEDADMRVFQTLLGLGQQNLGKQNFPAVALFANRYFPFMPDRLARFKYLFPGQEHHLQLRQASPPAQLIQPRQASPPAQLMQPRQASPPAQLTPGQDNWFSELLPESIPSHVAAMLARSARPKQ